MVILGRQAKTLNSAQVRTTLAFLGTTQQPVRNRVIFLLSLKAGLRAKEIASITWSMVCDAEGNISDTIRLTDHASKGQSGGYIPIAKELGQSLAALKLYADPSSIDRIVQTNRTTETSAQTIINLFASWYQTIGFEGCSSHSGRRTFITNAARNISKFGGSLRDVQALARHSSLTMTQRYIEIDAQAMRKVVDA